MERLLVPFAGSRKVSGPNITKIRLWLEAGGNTFPPIDFPDIKAAGSYVNQLCATMKPGKGTRVTVEYLARETIEL